MAASQMFMLLLFVIAISGFGDDRSIYLVLMEGDPVLFSRGAAPLEKEKKLEWLHSEVSKRHAKMLVDCHDQLLQSTLETGSYKKLYSFKHIVNGFAIHTTASQAEKLASAPGVKLVEKDRGAKLMTTYTPQFLRLPQGVWAQAGGDRNAGEGVVIGFIDTGINPIHPSFAYDPTSPFTSNHSRFAGACESGPQFPATSCNGKIISARFFSAGAQAAAHLNTSTDILSPFDAVGHGSHVASTAAGNAGVPVIMNGFFFGRASGMAPRAQIAVYKAIYPSIGTIADVVSAVEQAVVDGVDVLTLSIGPDAPPEDTITFLNIFDIVMLFARRAGLFVVQAAGNQGPAPSTVVSFSPWAVGVAACTTGRSYPATLILGNGDKIGGVGLSAPTFGNRLLQYKLVLARDSLNENGTFPNTPQYIDECQYPEAFDPFVVQGSIVMCTFSGGFFNGTSTITAIIEVARALGFVGFVLLANPVYGDFVAEALPFSIPGIMIPRIADAQVITRYYEQNTQRDARRFMTRFSGRAAIGEGRVASFTGRAPVVSRFSSRGPDILNRSRIPVDVLKPDILAPGHGIWAAWSPMSTLDPILVGYSFALLSGTSMATPHVAGIAALVKQNHPSWSPSMIASAITTTATKYDNLGEPIMAEGYAINSLSPSTPFDYGAGLINPTNAVNPGLVFSSGFDDYVSLLCSLPNIDPSTIKAATGGSCNRSFSDASDLNLPSITISSLVGSRLVQRSVLNVGSKPEIYSCSVLQPKGVMVESYPSYFTIAPQTVQQLKIQINVTQEMDDFSFGEIVLTGSLDHIVRIPLSFLPVSIS